MKRDKSGRFVAKKKKRTVGRLGGRASKRENLQKYVNELLNRSAYLFDEYKSLERVALRPSTRTNKHDQLMRIANKSLQESYALSDKGFAFIKSHNLSGVTKARRNRYNRMRAALELK